MSRTSPYIVGPPIEDPVNFYGRQDEVDRFFALLNGSQPLPIQVVGLWRSGKTSFLKYVSNPDIFRRNIRTREDKQMLVAYVNLQAGVAVPEDFYLSVAKAMLRALSSHEYPVCPERFDSKRAFDLWLNKLNPTPCQWIILLDEFDALRDRKALTLDFFYELRSYIGDSPIVWVTCSYLHLYRIAQMKGREEKTSPLFNVFYPIPIVMGALSIPDTQSLIVRPAKKCGIDIPDQAVEAIMELAGRLPFFVQFAADTWLLVAPNKGTIQERKERVASILLGSMAPYFRGLWLKLNESEKRCLYQISMGDVPYCQARTVSDLRQYGLLYVSGEEQLCIAGSVFAKWIQTEAPTFEERSIAMSADPESIVPFVPIIVEATKFVFNEVSKWIDDVRKKAQNEASAYEFSLALPITESQFSEIQSHPQALALMVNESVVRTQAFLIKELLAQIQQHRKNIARWETKKAEAAEMAPIAYDTWIEKQANELIRKTKELVGLLAQVYEKS